MSIGTRKRPYGARQGKRKCQVAITKACYKLLWRLVCHAREQDEMTSLGREISLAVEARARERGIRKERP